MIELKTFIDTHTDFLSTNVKDWLKENPNIKIISTSQSYNGNSTMLNIFYKKKFDYRK